MAVIFIEMLLLICYDARKSMRKNLRLSIGQGHCATGPYPSKYYPNLMRTQALTNPNIKLSYWAYWIMALAKIAYHRSLLAPARLWSRRKSLAV